MLLDVLRDHVANTRFHGSMVLICTWLRGTFPYLKTRDRSWSRPRPTDLCLWPVRKTSGSKPWVADLKL